MIQAITAHTPKAIVYLGGLGQDTAKTSPHLQSRHEVEHILKQSLAPLTILRAVMIVGSGSASFEVLRYLVERLPLMLIPKWGNTRSQPIAIRNVIHYLLHTIDNEQALQKSFDIGGTDILTYEDLIRTYQEEVGLSKRVIMHIP